MNNKYQITMITFIKWTYLFLAVFVGLGHLRLGLTAIFVFRESEPFLSWVIIILGPILTLPTSIIGFWFPRVSAWVLIVGGVFSLLLVAFTDGLHSENVLIFAIKISVPMLLLAIMSIIRIYFK